MYCYLLATWVSSETCCGYHDYQELPRVTQSYHELPSQGINWLQVSPASVRQGEVRSRPGGLLLEALMALPDLAGRHHMSLHAATDNTLIWALWHLIAALAAWTAA